MTPTDPLTILAPVRPLLPPALQPLAHAAAVADVVAALQAHLDAGAADRDPLAVWLAAETYLAACEGRRDDAATTVALLVRALWAPLAQILAATGRDEQARALGADMDRLSRDYAALLVGRMAPDHADHAAAAPSSAAVA